MSFQNELEGYMMEELKRTGMPSSTVEEFSEQYGYSLQDFKEKTKNIDFPKLWDSAIEKVSSQLDFELTVEQDRFKVVESKLNSFRFKIPFLFRNQKELLLNEKERISDIISKREISITNAHYCHEFLKVHISEFHQANQQEKLFSNNAIEDSLPNNELEKDNIKDRQKSYEDYELEL